MPDMPSQDEAMEYSALLEKVNPVFPLISSKSTTQKPYSSPSAFLIMARMSS